MLFKAEITNETAKDRDKLVEQLYIFLNEFAYARLRYESKDDIEDCIQDTIMYMIKRFDDMPKTSTNYINLEKYFYNRANSYVSYWLGGKIRNRKNISKYISNKTYIDKMDSEGVSGEDYIDYSILENIITEYNLDTEKSKFLLFFSSKHLEELGFISDEYIVNSEIIYPVITNLVYAVVDEYLVKSVILKENS